jgi:hypothetical protein
MHNAGLQNIYSSKNTNRMIDSRGGGEIGCECSMHGRDFFLERELAGNIKERDH